MANKTIKFRDHLATQVLSREKTATWRLFDDKDLSVGDIVDLINWDTGEVFAQAEITTTKEKKLGDIEDADFVGHEKYTSETEMYEDFKKYYGDKVTTDAVVKMLYFRLI